MKIKKVISQNKKDFYAIYKCEHCGCEEKARGYDDALYFYNEIPEMACMTCGKKRKDIVNNENINTTNYYVSPNEEYIIDKLTKWLISKGAIVHEASIDIISFSDEGIHFNLTAKGGIGYDEGLGWIQFDIDEKEEIEETLMRR